MKTKRRLKKWVKVVLWCLTLTLLTIYIIIGMLNYIKWLHKCDTEKGYTCNIFGK